MKLSKLKKQILLVLYQRYKRGENGVGSVFYDVSNLADYILGDDAFYRSDRTGQRVIKNSISTSLSRSIKRLKKDGLVVLKKDWYMGKWYLLSCLTPKGVRKAREFESEIMDWTSLIKRA